MVNTEETAYTERQQEATLSSNDALTLVHCVMIDWNLQVVLFEVKIYLLHISNVLATNSWGQFHNMHFSINLFVWCVCICCYQSWPTVDCIWFLVDKVFIPTQKVQVFLHTANVTSFHPSCHGRSKRFHYFMQALHELDHSGQLVSDLELRRSISWSACKSTTQVKIQ